MQWLPNCYRCLCGICLVVVAARVDAGQCAAFQRGDSDDDSSVRISDAIFTLNYLFRSGAAPNCLDAADINDDGTVNISDPIFTLNYLFRSGTPPFPPVECGPDPTADLLGCLRANGCLPCKQPASNNVAPFVSILSPAPGESVEPITSVEVKYSRDNPDGGHPTGYATRLELIIAGQLVAAIDDPERVRTGTHVFREVDVGSLAGPADDVCMVARVRKAAAPAELCRDSSVVVVSLVE